MHRRLKGSIFDTFRLLTLELHASGKLFSYLRTIPNILINLIAGSQGSNRCPFELLVSSCKVQACGDIGTERTP